MSAASANGVIVTTTMGQITARNEHTHSKLAALEHVQRVEPTHIAGLLDGHSIEDVTLLWDALCTGLAMREIQCAIQPLQGERIWTDALMAPDPP